MATKEGGFKGGQIPTGLATGNDGFSKIVSHKATFEVGSGTVEVGREPTVGSDQVESGGRKK